MPNIKSAIKRVSVNAKKRDANRSAKTELSNEIKKFKQSVLNKEEKLDEKFNFVVSAIDGACSKNLIHKSNADRKKSRLALFMQKNK